MSRALSFWLYNCWPVRLRTRWEALKRADLREDEDGQTGLPRPRPIRWLAPAGVTVAIARADGTEAAVNLLVASLVHALALWLWHAPVLFEATLRNEAVHALQHVAFFGTALLFWQAMLFGEHRAADYGLAVVYLFVTALHSGALGALLTFASRLWYPSYADNAAAWGLTPLEDQQLGGLIMWIPAGLVYVGAGLALFAAWLRESNRRALGSGARVVQSLNGHSPKLESRMR